MFSVHGRMVSIEGIVTVAWHDGQVFGDRKACDLLRSHAKRLEGFNVGPVEGPYTRHDHLASDMATVSLLMDLFDRDATWSGDVPVRGPAPIDPEPDRERKGTV